MNDKDLFDALDPETWQSRPLQKVFLLHNFDVEKSTQEELRQTLFAKFKEWTGNHLEKIDKMMIERFYEDLTEDPKVRKIVPAIQVRFTLKSNG